MILCKKTDSPGQMLLSDTGLSALYLTGPVLRRLSSVVVDEASLQDDLSLCICQVAHGELQLL